MHACVVVACGVCFFLLHVDIRCLAFRATFECLQCSSVENGQPNPDCPARDYVFAVVDATECRFGACYTTLENVNGQEIAHRGCTNDLPDMPYTLPREGCYTWKGKSICVCFSGSCNIAPGEYSQGKELDDHLKHPDKDRGPVRCYQCMNKNNGTVYTQCPKDDAVISKKVYIDRCNGSCFTRTFQKDPSKVARGCTDYQWGLPVPLPPDGCYNWNGDVWCMCGTDGCNGRPMGQSSGKELDDHLDAILDNYVEKDGLNRCYECVNYFNGTHYKQCPKNKRVRNAYLSECNGTCFTRSYDYDDKKVARGCTLTQWGLPDPLPPDGCYKWYSEVWCVCSTTRCNRMPIGEPQDIEFDAHIPKPGGRNSAPHLLYSTRLTLCYYLTFSMYMLYRYNNIVFPRSWW